MTRDYNLKTVLGEDKFNAIHKSKILLVGAGGIGCELLKDLVLLGFGEIHVVDLDTIDLSNLNRQFLFRHKDIKQPKSFIAIDAVSKFNFHNSKLIPYQASIFETDKFPLSWFNSFDLIFNALDNAEARSYINKIGLFLNKNIMETGTTGINGYVQATIPNLSSCYDCLPRETPKTFPVCTIRSTPSQPIHCIHWAKNVLFNSLFGEDDSDEIKLTDKNIEQLGTDNEEEIKTLLAENNELIELKNSIFDDSFVDKIISKIFIKDIENLLKIDELWKLRKSPIPIKFDQNVQKKLDLITQDQLGNGQKIWSIEENLKVLISSTKNLQARYSINKEIEFDKDDEDTLNFVVASANIRSYIFHIQLKSKFDIKSIAGNIIPAVATTNAFIAGFSSLLSLKVFQNIDAFKDTKSIYTSQSKERLISSGQLSYKNPKCASCSITRSFINIDNSLTVKELIDSLIDKYQYEEEIAISIGSKLLYDIDFDDNIDKKLIDLGITYGVHLSINDETDLKNNVEFYIELNDEGKIQLPDLIIPDKPKPIVEDKKDQNEQDDDNVEEEEEELIIMEEENDDDDLVILESISSTVEKRKNELELIKEDAKKPKN
ncbi:hypothetical protein WICMUC_003085 [Wickerhamomyces mucosus]|uniref:Ubiquitin-activating enzyme E1-like n=1 Tax=Wickerhamomyces mucosus TaxID=1378264 RepID=A0A9P8PNF3_9ASCO|nr:hypothetical protein WICMUC_003085 [Wickerhamomyces mucosus]